MPITVSDHFKLSKSQNELDFVDVFLYKDLPLFVDPLPLSQRVDNFSQDCHATIKAYFQCLIDCLRAKKDKEVLALLMYLREPNETRLGFSSHRPKGAGIGSLQAKQIFDALKSSAAIKTGLISSLAECELMIDGIGIDKISDLTTNIIRGHLIKYTQEQCNLHGIPIEQVPMPPCFNPSSMQWEFDYRDLPVIKRKPILLVPKTIVKVSCAMQHQEYYRHYVLEYMQDDAIAGGAYSSLVTTLKNKKKVIYKKQLEEKEPCTKEFLFRFSLNHADVLEKYRDDLEKELRVDKESDVDEYDEKTIAKTLINAIRSIPPGSTDASRYHKLMIGVVEFIFHPHLLYPIKEQEIHSGRKRIDISMENGARDGILRRLSDTRKVPCGKVFFECKNYSTDVANPAMDQLAGRFGVNRGQFGFLCCRRFEDRSLFLERCKDTLRDGRGLIVPLDDSTVIILLDLIEKGSRQALDQRITNLIDEVWL